MWNDRDLTGIVSCRKGTWACWLRQEKLQRGYRVVHQSHSRTVGCKVNTCRNNYTLVGIIMIIIIPTFFCDGITGIQVLPNWSDDNHGAQSSCTLCWILRFSPFALCTYTKWTSIYDLCWCNSFGSTCWFIVIGFVRQQAHCTSDNRPSCCRLLGK